MKKVIVKIVHAFSMGTSGGNPAGVVLNANGLSKGEKQLVAAKLGLSEIAFVSKSVQADFKLDFFTPTRQIAHCGHATIATFTYLKKLGLIRGDRSSKETVDGIRDIYFKNGLTYMEQTSPSHVDVKNEANEILQSLNLSKSDLLKNHTPSIVNTGNSFLIVAVASNKILKEIKPNLESVKKYSEKKGLIGYYVFSLSTEDDFIASTRMFAPFYGIDEESATGMAAGPLACYLFENNFTTKSELKIKQGEHMTDPSPSTLVVNLTIENGNIKKLYAGGNAYVSEERYVQIE